MLLCVYLAVLVLLARLLEAVAYLEGGSLANKLLDPVALSVRRLKILLDRRGISYAGVVEKQELTELINASGDVREGELTSAELQERDIPVTNFTCGTHFYEEVWQCSVRLMMISNCSIAGLTVQTTSSKKDGI